MGALTMCHHMTQAERERWLEREQARREDVGEEESKTADPEPEKPEIPTPSD